MLDTQLVSGESENWLLVLETPQRQVKQFLILYIGPERESYKPKESGMIKHGPICLINYIFKSLGQKLPVYMWKKGNVNVGKC